MTGNTIQVTEMRKSRLLSALLCSTALCPQSGDNDTLIVPGVRVGPVTRTSTEQSLRQVFGSLAIRQNVEIGEGVEEPGLVLYPGDPSRRLEITWNTDRPPHPAMIFVCRSENSYSCQWRTAHGIGIGSTLRELEKASGRPFEMVGWGSDVGGNLTSFQGGRLENELRLATGALTLSLVPRIDANGNYLPRLTDREFSEVQGEKFLLSRHSVLQKLNPFVSTVCLVFPSAERRP